MIHQNPYSLSLIAGDRESHPPQNLGHLPPSSRARRAPCFRWNIFRICRIRNAGGIVLVTTKNLPVNNLKDLITLVKANPGKFSYGSSETTPRACVLINQYIGDAVNVRYRGTSHALQDVAAGQINYLCDVVGTVKRQIDSGAVKAIAILNKERSKELPDVPTALE